MPGYFDFIGESIAALRVVETAGIVVGAVNGLSVGAEKAWANAGKTPNVCRMFIINQMDRENADYNKVLEALRSKFSDGVVPLVLPIGSGAGFKGVGNILENKAFEGTGKNLKEVPVPANMAGDIENAMAELTEAAASAFCVGTPAKTAAVSTAVSIMAAICLSILFIFPPSMKRGSSPCCGYSYSAPSCRSTTPTVLNRIRASSSQLQFRIYHSSSRTTSSKSVILLRPLTCHMPVIPGLALIRIL